MDSRVRGNDVQRLDSHLSGIDVLGLDSRHVQRLDSRLRGNDVQRPAKKKPPRSPGAASHY